jgi:tetratricopeptide (TPR) repeat protein
MRKAEINPDELLRRAAELCQAARPDEAEPLYRTILAATPGHVDALRGLGTLLYRQNRHSEAVEVLSAAVDVRPADLAALTTLGLVQSALGRPDEALLSYDRALAHNDTDTNLLNDRGVALADLKFHDQALASYDAALALEPRHIYALNNRGNALRELGRPAEAVAAFDMALAINPEFPQAVHNRAVALANLGRTDEALAEFDRAALLKPDYSDAFENKGLVLAELGRFDEARRALEHAIALTPTRVRTYFLLADCVQLTLDDPNVRAMQDLAKDVRRLTTDEQIDLNFALGKVFADHGDHAKAFPRVLEANALRRQQIHYDEAATLAALQGMPAVFTDELLRAGAGLGAPSDRPIFIVGMPRSGTTLIEQILASHPRVFGAGETYDFTRAIAGLGSGDDDDSIDDASRLWDQRMRQLGESYLQRISALAPDAERIADKTPENFRVIGLIRLALPNARIIHARRDALDTCISCFSRQFVDLPYTYDLAELGRHYQAYQALMAHWRSVVPAEVMLDVQYEEVVDDLEAQARRIIDHCGLEWDPRCLDFHLTDRVVRTASNTQVRRPIYASSVGRWRAYERWIEPLIKALDPSFSATANGS